MTSDITQTVMSNTYHLSKYSKYLVILHLQMYIQLPLAYGEEILQNLF